MITQAKRTAWIERTDREWAMPVCMQPRAVACCRIVDGRTNRPLSLKNDAYRLRVGRTYQLEIGKASDGTRPASVAFLSGPLVPVSSSEPPSNCDDSESIHLDCRIPEPESHRWLSGLCASRFESSTVCVSYADGRATYEQRIPIVAVPDRARFIASIVTLAMLLAGLPAVCYLVHRYASVSPDVGRVLSVCSRTDLGAVAAAAVVVLAFVMFCLDRLRVRLRIRRFRNSQRRDVLARIRSLGA